MKFTYLPSLLFGLVLFILSLVPIADPDLGWHIRFGQEMISTWQIPYFDTFSFSLPGHALVDHSWLQDIFIYLFYDFLGMAGISFWYGLLIMATGFVLLQPQKLNWAWLVGIFLIGFGVYFIGLRPHLVTLLGLSLTYQWTKSLKFKVQHLKEFLIVSKAYWLIGFFVVWANMHAGVVVGELFFGLLLVIHFGHQLLQKKFDSQLFGYAVFVFVVCVLATLVNPYGLGLYEFVFNLAGNSATLVANQDWLPLLSSRFPSETLGPRMFLVLLSFMAFGLASKTKDRTLVAISFLLTLISVRFSLVLLVVLIPVLSKSLKSYLEAALGKVNYLKVSLILFFVLVARISTLSDWWCSLDLACYQQLNQIPVKEVKALSKLDANAKVLNEYSLGGYLVWQYPKRSVFIDGRMDGFWYQDKAFIQVYGDLYNAQGNWEELLADFEIEYLLLPQSAPLYQELDRQNRLEVVEGELVRVQP